MGVSIVMGVLKMDGLFGLFQGKTHLEMDNDWGYPILGNPHMLTMVPEDFSTVKLFIYHTFT